MAPVAVSNGNGNLLDRTAPESGGGSPKRGRGLTGFLTDWFLPFLQDYVFYGVFVLVLSECVFRPLAAASTFFTKVVLVFGTTFLWAWVLILLYTGLQAAPSVWDRLGQQVKYLSG